MSQLFCIMTGDLLGSSGAADGAVDATFRTLTHSFAQFDQWWPTSGGARLTRYRGDGWQALLAQPDQALRAALYLLARLRAQESSLGSRIALGFGTIDRLGPDTLADASGAAFTASGRLLDALPRGQVLAVAGTGITPLHQAVALLLGERVQKWSPEQAQAVALSLDHSTRIQADVAARLGISVQAVNARLSAAGYPAILGALDLWDQANRKLWHD
ncbi:hypothetical protein [Pseudotabrizicola sp. L79]|uniref:hypothetical protein n=1 Tax=Pseudotabrizicola sp. L79 TaxID=3118402 RepID=UPI002F93EB20